MAASSGTTADQGNAAPPTPNLATQIRVCDCCKSHFASDTEDPFCPACVEWEELYRRNGDLAHSVRGKRGGRR